MASKKEKRSFGVITSAPTAIIKKKSANLSNSDFRALLAGESEAQTLGEPKKKKITGKRLESYQKWQKKQEKHQEKQTLKYRDRAKERREDLNPDYKDSEHYDDLSVEKSKFLGGDIAHTHLVKGLDYALANKMREEDKKRERLDPGDEDYEDSASKPEKEKKKTSLPYLASLGTREEYYSTVAGDDSDEEGPQMDRGSRPRRWDMEVEEDNQKQGKTRKGYQFGLKPDSNGQNNKKRKREYGNSRKQEELFNKQWKQIQQIMKKREGAGTARPTVGSTEKIAKRQKILRGFAK